MPRHHRVVIDGTLAGGAERWSCGIAYTADAITPTSAELATWAEAILTSLAPTTGQPATLKGYVSSSGSIQRVRTYSYPDVGAPADRQGVSVGAALVGAGSANMPPQCSMVVTLLTGIPGKSTRGRFYWPHVGGTVSNGGKSSLVGQTTATAFSGLLSNWGTLIDGVDIRPAVVSEKTGLITPVSTVSVGDVIDTQRRRRDGLVETRFVSALA